MIVVEDGTGLSDSVSFASVAEFNAYCAARLYSSDALAATDDDKEKGLQMASRLLDSSVEWKGQRKVVTQALGWPRMYAVQAALTVGFGYGLGFGFSYGFYPYQFGATFYDDASVPKGIKDATCELAITLLKADRTADAPGKGIKSFGVGQNAVSVTFDPKDARELLTDAVYLLVRPFGSVITARGTRFVPTVRG